MAQKNTIQDVLLKLVLCEPGALLPTGCWEWSGSHTAWGYGQVQLDGKNRRVHRIVYQHLRGAIPDGLDIHHLCRNRSCANPDHLEPVSRRIHLLLDETIIADQVKRTHCPKGHAYSGDNLYVTSQGKRQCKSCWRIKWEANPEKCREATSRSYRKKRDAIGLKPRVLNSMSEMHCLRGHPFDDTNTRYRSNGLRVCRACGRENMRNFRAKRKSSSAGLSSLPLVE